ncbi:MAG: hypothetical protein ABWY66_14610 [Xanthobacteraceae bacterium]|jgi:hypothetical protein
MVEKPRGETLAPPRRGFDMRDLSRVATWGLVTLGALTIAAYAASSEVGEDRLIVAVANFRGVPPPERLARAPSDRLTHQLATTVRELSADREQLLARLDTLERNVSDVTGSIARVANQPVAPAPAILPPVVPVPDVVTAAPAVIAPDPPPARRMPPAQSDEPAAPKTEFGVDLGRANSVDGLRQLWNTVKGRHGGALEGLRPIVAVREIARSGGVEVRLVAGPLPNAAAAARICALLPGSACHPTVFDGQRLALR